MPDGYYISEALLRRILDAVGWIERERRGRGGPAGGSGAGTSPLTVPAEITGSAGAAHDWREVRRTAAGGWEVMPSGLTSAASGQAYEANGRENVPPGTVVRLSAGVRADGQTLWLFDLGAAPEGTRATLGSSGETEAAATDTWDVQAQPSGKTGVTVTRLWRLAYSNTGDQVLYAYYRNETYDGAGNFLSASAETRVTISLTEECV